MQECPYCKRSVTNAAIDTARDLAICPGCRRVIDFRRHAPTYASGPQTMPSSTPEQSADGPPRPMGIVVRGFTNAGAIQRGDTAPQGGVKGTQPSPGASRSAPITQRTASRTQPSGDLLTARSTVGAGDPAAGGGRVAGADSGRGGLDALSALPADSLTGNELMPSSQSGARSRRLRQEVPLPKGVSVVVASSGAGKPTLTIAQRTSGAGTLVMLVVTLAIAGGVGVYTAQSGVSATFWGAAAALLLLFYAALAASFNRTTTRVAAGTVVRKHGPLPSLASSGARVSAEQVKELCAVKIGRRFAVIAQLNDGKETTLVTPAFSSAEQALYVVDAIDQALSRAP